MKFAARPFADPDIAARKLVEIANPSPQELFDFRWSDLERLCALHAPLG
jgi:hypothetical protein